MKVAPLNRWDFYKNLGTRIFSFGLIFSPEEFLQVWQKRKRGRGTVPAGPEQPQGSGPAEPTRARARQV